MKSAARVPARRPARQTVALSLHEGRTVAQPAGRLNESGTDLSAGQEARGTRGRGRRAAGHVERPRRETADRVSGFDEHLEPGEALARLYKSDMPSSDERRRLRKVLAAALAGSLPGSVAGRFQQTIEAAKTSEVPWQQLLARFVTGLRRSDYRWYPFNRKHLWRGYYLPALGVPGPEHLAVFVDTSGSMTDEILAQVAAELDRLRAVSECRLTVVQSDVKVQKVDVFEVYEASSLGKSRKATTFSGRGGTDLRAPFDWLERQARAGQVTPAPDAVIFLTDGFGQMPSRPPAWPLLWLMTKDGVTDVPYGSVVRLGV